MWIAVHCDLQNAHSGRIGALRIILSDPSISLIILASRTSR